MDVNTWVPGSYEPTIDIELGTFWDDPRTWGQDAEWNTETVTVPVTFSLVCDIDGDGSLAEACGGSDCNDEDASIFPAATEDPNDSIDHNCDGDSGSTGGGTGTTGITGITGTTGTTGTTTGTDTGTVDTGTVDTGSTGATGTGTTGSGSTGSGTTATTGSR
ncbi:MAG: hypothetical protein GXP62_15535 [Oligoflexia bacterium]|nr:hypothetical protein [Oligoflexia bacterium]